MIERKIVTKPSVEIVGYVCDICHKRIVAETSEQDFDAVFECQEMIHIRHECGYGSVFGDGTILDLDICQHCFKKWLEKREVTE